MCVRFKLQHYKKKKPTDANQPNKILMNVYACACVSSVCALICVMCVRVCRPRGPKSLLIRNERPAVAAKTSRGERKHESSSCNYA